MANLFSANWNLVKFEISKTERDFNTAVSNDDKEEALQCFEQMQTIFETKTCINIASFFQKLKVNSLKKKVLGRMEQKLLQKGWVE